MEKIITTLKTSYMWIKSLNSEQKAGLLLLLPSLLSVIPFIVKLFDGFNDDSFWTGYDVGDGGFTSALPIYIGLMAIAGAYLFKKRN
jgi:hypothetical protein